MLLIPFIKSIVDMTLFGFVGQQYYSYWIGVRKSVANASWTMLTMSLGFNDRIYLKYETMPDRAVLPLTFLVGSLSMCNLVSLHYKVYCILVPVFPSRNFVAD